MSSGTCNIIDGIFYDGGNNTNWVKSAAINTSVENNEVLLTNTSTGQTYYFANIITGTDFDFDVPVTVEFDLIDYTENTLIYINNNDANGNTWFSQLVTMENQHVKIVITNETIKYYIDGVEVVSKSFVTSNKIRVGFRLNGNATFRYKDFVVYPFG